MNNLIILEDEKFCRVCEEVKKKTEFHSQKNGVLQSYCKPCQIQYNREYKIKKAIELTFKAEPKSNPLSDNYGGFV